MKSIHLIAKQFHHFPLNSGNFLGNEAKFNFDHTIQNSPRVFSLNSRNPNKQKKKKKQKKKELPVCEGRPMSLGPPWTPTTKIDLQNFFVC